MSNPTILDSERESIKARIRDLERTIQEAQEALPRLRAALAAMGNQPHAPISTAIKSDRYRSGETIASVVDVLTRNGEDATTRQILNDLLENGWESKAKEPVISLFGILRQETMRPHPRIIKTGPGKWGISK
jgi:hypothetical protein